MIAHLSNWVILLVKEMWTSSLKIIVTHDHYSFCLLELPRNRSSSKKRKILWNCMMLIFVVDGGWIEMLNFHFNLRHIWIYFSIGVFEHKSLSTSYCNLTKSHDNDQRIESIIPFSTQPTAASIFRICHNLIIRSSPSVILWMTQFMSFDVW